MTIFCFILFKALIDLIGILLPGQNLFCLNLLSSIIKSNFTLEKLMKVLAFAAAPYPTTMLFFLRLSIFVFIFLTDFKQLIPHLL